jgi:hypothetical protein
MSFYEIKFIPKNGSTGGKYRFFDVVFYENPKKLDEIKKEFQLQLQTPNVKVSKRSSM